MDCILCSQGFNKEKKVPLVLPCGHSFCKECLLAKETAKWPIVCSIDQEEVKCSVDKLKKNFIVLELLDKRSVKIMGKYFCSKHPKEEFQFRCNVHKELLCNLCMWDHVEHKKQVESYSEEGLLNDMQEIEGGLDIKIKDLQRKKQSIQDIKKGAISSTSQIKETFVKVLEPFSGLDLKKEGIFPFSLAKGIAPLRIKSDIDESVILTPEETELVMNWLPNPNSQTKLLLRGSVDGYSSQIFHQKCDNKGITICILKSNHNKVFGGYTILPWNGALSAYSTDTTDSCFIFSVTNKTKHLLKVQGNAIYGNVSYGVTFGGGHDIYIANNNTEANYSNFGHSYIADGIAEPKNYMAGAYNFTLLDYEVYKVHK